MVFSFASSGPLPLAQPLVRCVPWGPVGVPAQSARGPSDAFGQLRVSGPVVKPGSQLRAGLTLSKNVLNAYVVPESSNRTTRVMNTLQSASPARVGKISTHWSWAESPFQISSACVRVKRTRSLNGAALAAAGFVSAESGSNERSQLSGKLTARTTEPTAPGITWIVPSSPAASVP